MSVVVQARVVEQLAAPVATRFLDRIRVKGKSEPLDLYQLGCDTSDQMSVIHRQYEEAWELYAAGYFDRAISKLQPLVAVDQPGAVLLARCVQLLRESPDSWDGIFQFAEK